MNHVITIGDIFWPAVMIGAGVLGIIVIIWILSIFADAWKH